MRHNMTTLKRIARIKIMQTVLKPVSHLSLLMPIYIQWTFASFDFTTPLFYTLHTSFGLFIFTISQVFLVNPKMMSDLTLLSHTDLPPVILVLLLQSLRNQHMGTDTQLAGAYDPLNLDGLVSPCHLHRVTQI